MLSAFLLRCENPEIVAAWYEDTCHLPMCIPGFYSSWTPGAFGDDPGGPATGASDTCPKQAGL